jgi:hypothetical protein
MSVTIGFEGFHDAAIALRIELQKMVIFGHDAIPIV